MDTSLQITLSELQRKDLLSTYLKKLEEVQSEIRSMQAVEREYLDFIEKLGGNRRPSKNQLPLANNGKALDGFDISWSWTKKIFFILNESQTLLTAREILEEIKVYNPEIGDPITSISATLSAKISSNKVFIKIKIDGYVDTLYGLQAWVNGDGSIPAQYNPKNKPMVKHGLGTKFNGLNSHG